VRGVYIKSIIGNDLNPGRSAGIDIAVIPGTWPVVTVRTPPTLNVCVPQQPPLVSGLIMWISMVAVIVAFAIIIVIVSDDSAMAIVAVDRDDRCLCCMYLNVPSVPDGTTVPSS